MSYLRPVTPSHTSKAVFSSEESQRLSEAVSRFQRRVKAKAQLADTSALSTTATNREELCSTEEARRRSFRGRSRPASVTGTPQNSQKLNSDFTFSLQFTPFSKESTDIVPKPYTEISLLQASQQDKLSQSREMRNFLTFHSLSSLSELHSLLLRKDQQINSLQTRLKRWETHGEVQKLAGEKLLNDKIEGLEMQIKQGEEQLEREKRQYEESRLKLEGLYESLARFQRENKSLLEENCILTEKIKDLELFSDLETQFLGLKSQQSQLLSDNSRLQEESKLLKSSETQLLAQLAASSSALHVCRKDLSQLTEVIRIIRQGEGVSAALVLGHMPKTNSGGDLQVLEDAAALRKDLETLRGLLADLYAEQSGHLCVTQ